MTEGPRGDPPKNGRVLSLERMRVDSLAQSLSYSFARRCIAWRGDPGDAHTRVPLLFLITTRGVATTFTSSRCPQRRLAFFVVTFFANPEGEPGSAAQHLDCRIHDVHLLTCDWQVGREAPSGVQYHLYLENVK